MRLRQHATTLAVAIVCVAVAAALPALAHGVEHALFAHDAGQVDGFNATGAGASASARAGKLVATNGDGRLPNNIIDRAPDASRLDGLDSTEYQQDLGRVITVAKSGGDFTSVAAALQSITDPSSSRRYVVRVGPGVFSAVNLEVQQFVTLEGAGPEATVLSMDNDAFDAPPAIVIDTDGTFRGLTVRSSDDHRTAISAGSRAVIDQVRVDLNNGGTGVNVLGSDVTIDHLDVDIIGGGGSSYGVSVSATTLPERSVSIENSRIVVLDESAAAVRASGEQATMDVRWSHLSGIGTGAPAAQQTSLARLTIASSELHNGVSGDVECRFVWDSTGEAAPNACASFAPS